MARFNEILVGRYNRFMQKLLSMKGPASLTQLAGEMQAVFPFFSGVENRYLESWHRFGVLMQIAAAAANQSAFRLRNPAGSNVIAVFEKILDQNNSAGAETDGLSQGAAGVDLATPFAFTTTRLDPRGQQNPTLILSQQNTTVSAPSLADAFLTWNMPANTNQDLILYENAEFTLFPGDAIQLFSKNVNLPLSTGFIWRERYLEDSERA
jgi:hypothetical protein